MGMIQRRKMLFEGELPPIITKIVGGSFQIDEPLTDGFVLEHNLGVKPRGYIIYDNVWKNTTDGKFDVNNATVRLISYEANGNSHHTTAYYRESEVYANNNGDLTTYNNNAYSIDYKIDASVIKWPKGRLHFVVGRTYEWIAWA